VARVRSEIEASNRGQEPAAPPLSTEPDGRYFGYIKSIAFGSRSTITVDFAEFLIGDQAQKAAEEAGAVAEGDPVPNDYFVSNVNPRLRTLRLDPEVAVEIETGGSTGGPDRRAISFDRWVHLFQTAKDELAGVATNGYWFAIRDGVIVKLREQWVP
jgi:hypothetical protein